MGLARITRVQLLIGLHTLQEMAGGQVSPREDFSLICGTLRLAIVDLLLMLITLSIPLTVREEVPVVGREAVMPLLKPASLWLLTRLG